MKRQTLLTLLLSIVAMMWANIANAGIVINGKGHYFTGNITGKGITGYVHYNAETKTLTLDNAHLTHTETVIENYDNGLRIVVKGNCSIMMNNTETYSSFDSNYSMTITGGGTLSIKGPGSAIFLNTNKPITITIEDCTIVPNGGTYGLSGREASTLTIRNATVKATGHKYGSIQGWKEILLEGCQIEKPAGATIGIDKGETSIMKDGKVVTTEVAIVPATVYDLKIAGTEVSSVNCKDLSVIDGVSGTVKYDHSTQTLTLDNATINATGKNDGIYTNNAINIVVKGTVNVTSEKNNALFLTGKSSINGTGTLYATGMSVCGIEVRDLTIEGCTVHAKGKWGIAGSTDAKERLTIRKATVTAEGEKGSICDLKTFTLDGCTITQPVGAAYSASLKGVALDGKIVTDKVVITKSTGITSPEVEAENVPSHKKGIYNLQGVRLGTSLDKLPAGIYIQDGKKVIKK